jgi:hypothetical protein
MLRDGNGRALFTDDDRIIICDAGCGDGRLDGVDARLNNAFVVLEFPAPIAL